MEEGQSVSTKAPQIPNPPNAAQNLPTSQSASAAAAAASRPPLPPHTKKRKSDNVNVQNPNYFKIRALVKDLRPHFIEVLRTPDFRNSKAAHEIRKKMKSVMDICKQITMETVSIEMSKKSFEGQPLSGENKDGQKLVNKHPEEKQGKHHYPDHVPEKSPELPLGGNNSEKLQDAKLQGTYVVGGSNFGWNFIMYPSGKPVYYGVTKESRQIAKEKMGTSQTNSK